MTKMYVEPRLSKGKNRSVEFSFKIEAYSPETFPMARLGEYMAQLGKLLGETTQVHFKNLAPGSTCIVHEVQWEAIPKIKQALGSVKSGKVQTANYNAFKELNCMLRADNANAAYGEVGKKAVILRFPGVDEKEAEAIQIRQHGSLTGLVTRVGGADTTAHVQLNIDGKRLGNFVTTRPIAKKLAAALYEPVRVHGEGKWKRDGEGLWQVEQFTIHSFEVLNDASLDAAIKSVRDIGLTWDENAFEELIQLRNEKTH